MRCTVGAARGTRQHEEEDDATPLANMTTGAAATSKCARKYTAAATQNSITQTKNTRRPSRSRSACADDTKGQTCYICTQALHWKTKEGLVRGFRAVRMFLVWPTFWSRRPRTLVRGTCSMRKVPRRRVLSGVLENVKGRPSRLGAWERFIRGRNAPMSWKRPSTLRRLFRSRE